MNKKFERMLVVLICICVITGGIYFAPYAKGEEIKSNIANGRNNYTYMTSNANNGKEGFCYVGNGFSAINAYNENLGNGNNMLGTTSTTDEVAIYVDLGNDYEICNALIYQGSTNSNYYDSYCTQYTIYYSNEQVNSTNKGQIEWKIAGNCTDGTIYSGAKIKEAKNVSDKGDEITFSGTYKARSVKIVFDKNACMGTGINGTKTGTIGTVSLLSVRIYGVKKEENNITSENGNIEDLTTQEGDTAQMNVLFIGNSMTYYNTLCNVVEEIASHKGHKINCTSVTNGGKNLIYQSTADNVLTAIKRGGYKIVVLQDIVGSFDADRLQEGVETIVPIIKRYNPESRIILYEPWPTKGTILGGSGLLPYFTNSYIKTAKSIGGVLAPAGEVFYDIYVNHGYDYYCSDGKHPQPLGTFISAASIYYAMYPEDTYSDFTIEEQSYIDDLINNNVAYTSEGVKDTYSLDVINLIMSLGYKYSHNVISAVIGTDKYVSVGGEYIDPDEGMNPDGLSSITGITIDTHGFINNKNIALDCEVYASDEKQSAANATDGDLGTRWETEYSDPQWLYIDLGATKKINKVGFVWEGAYASKYYIQVSDDAKNWKTVALVKAGSASTVQIDLEKTYTTRYVRMYGTKRGTGYGYSFYEIGVWYDSEKDNNTTTKIELDREEITTGEQKTTVDNIETTKSEISTSKEKTSDVVESYKDDVLTTKIKREKKVNLPKVKIKKINKTNKSKKIKLSVKKIKQADGYQIVLYKKMKKVKKNIFKKNIKKNNVTIKSNKFKNRKNLYVKVRAYTYDEKLNKVYGKWSNMKKVRIR